MEEPAQSFGLLFQILEAFERGQGADADHLGLPSCVLGYANTAGYDQAPVFGVDG